MAIFTLYICKDVSTYGEGRVRILDFDLSATTSASLSSKYVLLGTVEQEIEVPDIDTNQLQINALEQAVQAERAESQSRVNILLDRISKLKAIGHEVAQ